MNLTLEQLNQASDQQAFEWLKGLYEHSDWVAQNALAQRPFQSLSHLKRAMIDALNAAGEPAQLALIRAHPELAGKAMISKTLTAESTHEQGKAGLTDCTPEEFGLIQKLNRDYSEKFGFPFIVAVRGPRGSGLTRHEIIETLARRVHNPRDYEFAEALRNIHRIVEMRLSDKFNHYPSAGQVVWDAQEKLALHSDTPEHLTVTYLTPAHRACALEIAQNMQATGFDEVKHDAVGNVIGIYRADPSYKNAPTLLTGSHFDTVRNGGKYDGRLGIFVPIACVQALSQQGRRLPFSFEVIGFSEEEGQRYRATFLASGALVGAFDEAWLEQTDADGVSMKAAMMALGLKPDDISLIKRNPKDYLGFVEVHIEQGPVLNELDMPLGVVTSINGSARYVGHITGMASHAGTTPMNRRRDAVLAVAELALFVEQRARQDGDSVGTVGQINVPNGSINVVPGRCDFSLDLRAPSNAQRDALAHDVCAELKTICERRGVRFELTEIMRAAAAPSDPKLQKYWEQAVESLGLPVFHLPSGAGHDAMKLHEIMPQAMLFVRGLHAGISHNPLESSTCDDMQLAIEAMQHLLDALAHDLQQ
jgi:beta-ureidopropionase / N-carbamoyl-L-amino-acid hydrolase